MRFLICVFAIFWGYFGISSLVRAEVSCQCPVLACDPCSVEHGVTFYTEKCGPADSKMRSCSRPTCLPIEIGTKECPVPPAASVGLREPVVMASAERDEALHLEEAATVGKVRVIQGSVSIVGADGKRTVVKGDAELKERETIEAAQDGAAIFEMSGGNRVHIHGDTQMAVQEFKNPPQGERRRAILNLIKGKIRNQVQQKYDGKTSYYKVVTKTAVAGVRGTDFVVEHKEAAKVETRVETLEGKVMLSGLSESGGQALYEGEGAVLSADLGGDKNWTPQNISISPVYKIPGERLQELDLESRVDVARRAKPVAEVVCRAPAADFNQCAWRCLGNPAGESLCRLDLPGVTCVRSRCNGNGVWADETRMPASYSSRCPGRGARVDNCDY